MRARVCECICVCVLGGFSGVFSQVNYTVTCEAGGTMGISVQVNYTVPCEAWAPWDLCPGKQHCTL